MDLKKINGLINIYKEKGRSSYSIINELKKIFKNKKIGHSGTLDINASGVLVVGIGEGTKVLEYLLSSKKTYIAELVFGLSSNTDDITGNISFYNGKKNISDIKLIEIIKIFNYFKNNTYLQIPSMYSNVKIKGKKLYEYAIKNIDIKIKPRKVKIYNIRALSDIKENYGRKSLYFYVEVSKGTYIRKLCVDIGDKIGIPCIMGNLERIKIGKFKKDNSFNIDEIIKKIKNKDFSFINSIDKALIKKNFIFINLDFYKEKYKKIKNGEILSNDFLKNFKIKRKIAFFFNNKLVSICKIRNNKIIILKNIN